MSYKEQNISEPIKTKFGFINGRDSVRMTNLEQVLYPSTIKIIGEFYFENHNHSIKWFNFLLEFQNVLAYRGFEFDHFFAFSKNASCFNKVLNSIWIAELNKPELNHYVFTTYDYVYEIISSNFELTINFKAADNK